MFDALSEFRRECVTHVSSKINTLDDWLILIFISSIKIARGKNAIVEYRWILRYTKILIVIFFFNILLKIGSLSLYKNHIECRTPYENSGYNVGYVLLKIGSLSLYKNHIECRTPYENSGYNVGYCVKDLS